ncbi:MAG TPA: UPF0236 family protein [Candidatus Limnocylindrales bacterium]|nr:UPF0236 family protein [Candidatus Limnocylindrales bacterium]
MDIICLVAEKVVSVTEDILKVLEGANDYRNFEAQLKEKLDSLCCDLLAVVLKTLVQKLSTSADRKRDWEVVRKKDHKEISTRFGQMAYKRNYHRHKESKRYAYLVDEQVGITPHLADRISSCPMA